MSFVYTSACDACGKGKPDDDNTLCQACRVGAPYVITRDVFDVVAVVVAHSPREALALYRSETHDESYVTAKPAECIDGPDGCGGEVDLRWSGYGSRSYVRCDRHGAERLRREDETRRRYGTDESPEPHDFDEADAGESWNEP
jgi:hypothetical protein